MAKIQDDSVLEISPTDVLVAPFKGSQQAEPESDSSDGDGEVEEQEDMLKRKGKPSGGTRHVFQQRELVSRAFAGDNVVKVCG
jgi:U3 small nucleolar RNA-associated protein 14